MEKYFKYIVIAITFSLILIALFFVVNDAKERDINKEEQSMQKEPEKMISGHGNTSTDYITYKIPAEIVSDKHTEIYAKVLSYIKSFNFDIGSHVNKGDVLIELESPEIIAQMSSLKSKILLLESHFKLSQSNYNRVSRASKTEGAISEFALEEVATKMQSDKAALDAAISDYEHLKSISDYLTIKAPFSGIISERNIDIGSLVGPNSGNQTKPLLVLLDNKKLRIRMSVTEKYAPHIAIGDTVSFNVGSGKQQANITRKSGALDKRLRSEIIEADIDNIDNMLLPGMVVDAFFVFNK